MQLRHGNIVDTSGRSHVICWLKQFSLLFTDVMKSKEQQELLYEQVLVSCQTSYIPN